MFCPKCGAENPEDGTFCQKCGASLSASSPAKTRSAKTGNPSGNIPEIFGVSIPLILLFGAGVALFLGFLTGVLAAAGAGDFVEGSTKASYFFDHFLDGVVFAGILVGFSAVVTVFKK